MKMHRSLFTGLLALSLFPFSGCHGQKTVHAAPGYDLNHPQLIELPDKIDEISGLSYDVSDASLYAIDDGTGKLYHIMLKDKPVVEDRDFAKTSDYEDLVLNGNYVYVLDSKGKILRLQTKAPDQQIAAAKLELDGQNEFETFYAERKDRMIMLCKQCDADGKHQNSAYLFNPSTMQFQSQPVYVLQRKDIERVLGQEISRFKPSAASVDPLTGEVYIISSVNKLLVVATTDMKVKAAYPLDPKLFKQPEGIAFAPNGDMFISNEAAGQGHSDILVFRHGAGK